MVCKDDQGSHMEGDAMKSTEDEQYKNRQGNQGQPKIQATNALLGLTLDCVIDIHLACMDGTWVEIQAE